LRNKRFAGIAGVMAGALVLGGVAAVAVAGPSASAAPTAAAATSGGVKFAYYDQWSIYGNTFYPKDLDTRGIASKLDFLVYDFENIDPTTLSCFEANKGASTDESNPNAGDGAEDAFADYQKPYTADISVDGVADTSTQPLVGTFNQLRKLKARHPNLKIVLSLGGWTYSKYFSDAASSAANRQRLVSSCLDMFIRGNLPAQGGFGGPGSAAGIFDGFDIDWEYVGAPGHTGNHFTSADTANYTALLAEFRSQLDAYGSSAGRRMWLTAAVPSGQDKIAKIQTNQVGQYLDYANVMTYDMHGAFEPQGPANHQAPLNNAPNDPMAPVPPGNEKYNIDTAIKAWTVGDSQYGIPGGFPANKLTMGFPFYYRGWTGVAAGSNHGLYQPASGPAAARALSQVPGVAYYKELGGIVDNASTTFFDPVAQAAYFYNGSEFWTGESAQSIQAKANYLHCNGLGGAMMFSLLDLDPATTLLNQVVTAVGGSAPGCTPTSPPPTTTPPTTTPPTTTPPTTTPPTTTAPGGSCTAAAWNASTAYTGGLQVSFNGHTWTAKWWTQGDIPGNNGQDVWTDNGPCGPTTPAPPGTCTAAPWNATTAYTGGMQVAFNGHRWQAKWWTQGDTPGNNGQDVWTDQGVCNT
jgi:chitinase